MLFVTVPLVDVLLNICDLNAISMISIAIIVIILICLWVCAAFWLYTEWHDSFN
jgi:hypothetical protein